MSATIRNASMRSGMMGQREMWKSMGLTHDGFANREGPH
jgi:hypothetical protein